MILALLSETAVAMSIYELDPELMTKMKKGKIMTEERRPSTGSIVRSLGHLTFCRIVERGVRKAPIYSNWNPLSKKIFSNIRSDKYANRSFSGG